MGQQGHKSTAGRNGLWAFVAVVVVLAVAGGAFYALTSGHRTPEVAAAVATAPAATPAQAAATTRSFDAAGAPLGVALLAASDLGREHSAPGCRTVGQQLSKAGTPTSLRVSAAELADPVAADLASDVVSAETQVLSECASNPGPSPADLATLNNVTAGLELRLQKDGGR